MKRFAPICCLVLAIACESLAATSVEPVELRCELLRDPVAVDAARPRLSWVLRAGDPAARSQKQTAYQVLAASSAARLRSGQADLWDSGKVSSDESARVVYEGLALASGQQCFWRVRVWDEGGRVSAWSAPARFAAGLTPADWQGQWIGRDEAAQRTQFTDADWIWFPEGRADLAAPVGTRYFRRTFELPSGARVRSARWLITGDNSFAGYVNGAEAGNGSNFKVVSDFDIKKLLRPGKNLLAAEVRNIGDAPNPAGFIGRLRIEFENHEPAIIIQTDETWRSSAEALPGWERPDVDDSTWLAARSLGQAGMKPWGDLGAPEDRRLPARWLRREFSLHSPVRRAVLYASGLGLSEFYLNGRRIGDAVLSPGLTEYDKRVFYVAHDVTSLLQSGANCLGAVLGNGRYFAPRSQSPTATRDYGSPKLLLQLNLEFTNGAAATLVSDGSWKLTSNGPIRANNEYDGEDYDARMELPGWDLPGYDDSRWSAAEIVAAPGGLLSAEPIAPIRVVEEIKPVSITEPQPGVFIFDMGQNLVGWCRLEVTGPEGAVVALRHSETLKPDGTLYLANLRGAKVTDHYTLKGKGLEIYEPRFTYHGFRFVEVTGFPGRPALNTLRARVVHDDLTPAGGFACSETMLNRIYTNVIWGVRGNYRSIPTDCPQRDERQGWLGDRSAESKGETYLYNIHALYAKWLRDMADAQKESGSVPDVCPSYWPIYSDNVTWPSSTVIIPSTLLLQFGDPQPIETHYESARRWMDYMAGFITNGIIRRDSYGDWCVPPEDPTLIHSKDPLRQTDRALLATAYFYYDATLMARYAKGLRREAESERFARLAEALKEAFNQRFLDREKGCYDNGSQTSCVLPLAFGLVPEECKARVFDHLLAKIRDESQGHIGTGLIGGQWLMQVLTRNGRPDIALQIAMQTGYPSWGYMVEKGATTIWELWNGDTADPAMNSGNHVMLVGDLVTWLHEDLAGIAPDPAAPGFKHVIMRPQPLERLRFAEASHLSPYGRIASRWERNAGKFAWRVEVPVNSRATLYVPARGPGELTESGWPLARAKGVKVLSAAEPGRVALEVGSGVYRFEAPF